MNALLELHGVTVTRAAETVLHDVTLTLNLGERLAIVGPNGAGKTSLLRTIVGLERHVGGSLRLFGTACSEERQFRQFRPRIGFLFQESDDQLFCPTVIEDVSFGPLNTGCTQAEAQQRAMATLNGLGLGHLADRICHRLSGGEKRLVCLAGLLAMEPEVLMLDEPTNGVDAANRERLLQALASFTGAMLLVSHDDGFIAELATRAMIIRDRRLVPAEIHQHPHMHSHPHIHSA